MKIGFYSPHYGQMRNKMFVEVNAASGAGDDLFLPFLRLRQAATQLGLECATVDTWPIAAFDAFVCCDIPNASDPILQALRGSGKPCYAMIFENHFLWSNNGDLSRYKEFTKVFTYNDTVVDGEKVIKLNYAFDLPRAIAGRNTDKKKLAVMICSNHKRDIRNLVYADRRDTINWFQEHQPDAFDLYGLNWGKGVPPFQTQPAFQRFLRRIGVLRFFPRKRYASWRGEVARKRDVLGNYRFGFCYENTTEIPGYITEKIFDVMMAGTVPVYLGPENAKRHIPPNCFVNRAEFPDHESLYTYLSTMTEELYSKYLAAIDAFISTKSSYEFSIECFVDRILSTIIKNGTSHNEPYR